MSRPTKEEQAAKKAKLAANRDVTDVDINKLDEALERDVAKSIGFGNDEDVVVEEVVTDDNNGDVPHDDSTLVGEQNQSYKFEMPPSNQVEEKEVFEDIPNAADDIPTENANPLEEEVKDREYTHFEKPNVNPNIPPQPEPFIPEPVNVVPQFSDVTIGIEEPKSNKPTESPKQPSAPKKEPINPNLEDLSPSQKRKAAEQSADAMLLAYGNLAPIPFKKISQFNIGKIDNLHLKGEIDKNMVVSDDGTTVKSHCEQVNQQVDQIFEITQEMKDEIRPPLIDVLLENNLALTPTQRLIMAVSGQILTMGLTSFQLMQQNKAALNQFKVFHKQNREDALITARANETIHIKPEAVKPNPVVQYQTESFSKKNEVVYEQATDAFEDIPTETSKKVENYLKNKETPEYTVEEVPNED